MKLNLKKPLVIFDLETTGLNITHDHIVEIGYIKVEPNGNEESKTMRINPGVHIPEESTAVHHISDEDVKDCPTFKQVAQTLAQTFEGCDLAGFNSNKFDIPMLVEEFMRAGVDVDLSKRKLVDVQNIYHKLERRTLIAAYKYYCGKDLENAHSALADTQATYEVLQAQLDKYPDELKNDIQFLADYSKVSNNIDFAGRFVYDDKGVEVVNFGKYKGVTIREVVEKDWQYIEWAVLQSQRLYVDVEAVVAYHDTCIVKLTPNDLMQFGKYKGQSLASVFANDYQYLR